MKKLFTLVLALCLLVGIMAVTASAEATAVSVKFENSTAADFTVTVEPGATAYVTSDDAKQFIKWTEAEAPTDKFVKLELSADGATLNATMKNIDVDSASGTAYTTHALEFAAGSYAVVLNLQGENKIRELNSACIKFNNDGGMTITGEGKLTLNIGDAEAGITGSSSGAIWANGGNLTIKNTQLDATINSPGSAKHHVIYSCKGSVAFEGSKLNINTQGGQLVFTGTGEAKIGRYTLDPATDRFITVKDCDIVANIKLTLFESTTAASISNSTVKITKASSSDAMFVPAPKFEGEYTAIAGLAKNAEKLDKLKVYDEKKLGSYTYFYMVPGIVDLLPTEPEVTVPDVTTPEETTPDTTTPDATTPESTDPVESTPTESKPTESKPTTDNKPSESKPAESKPSDNKTDPTGEDTAKDDNGGSGNPLIVILIVLVALIVVAGGTFGVLLYLKKKKA